MEWTSVDGAWPSAEKPSWRPALSREQGSAHLSKAGTLATTCNWWSTIQIIRTGQVLRGQRVETAS